MLDWSVASDEPVDDCPARNLESPLVKSTLCTFCFQVSAVNPKVALRKRTAIR